MSENAPPGAERITAPWFEEKITRSVSFTLEGEVDLVIGGYAPEDQIEEAIKEKLKKEFKDSGYTVNSIEVYE